MTRHIRSLAARINSTFVIALLMLIGFTTGAYAATAALPDPDGSWLDLGRPILDAVIAGHGWIAAAGVLIMIAALARRVLSKYVPAILSPIGGILTVFVGAYGGALLTVLAAHDTTTANSSILFAALKVALAAAGGFAALRPLLVDVIEPFVVGKLPWLAPVFDLLTFFFDKPPTYTEVATKAGNDAVIASPGAGAASVVGSSTEIK